MGTGLLQPRYSPCLAYAWRTSVFAVMSVALAHLTTAGCGNTRCTSCGDTIDLLQDAHSDIGTDCEAPGQCGASGDASDDHSLGPCSEMDVVTQKCEEGVIDHGGCWPACADMVTIPAGEFWMGCNFGEDPYCQRHESPMHLVYLDEYRIDRTEVTYFAYLLCVWAGACAGEFRNSVLPDSMEVWQESLTEPVWPVTWAQANTYCNWAGKRLPTEAEWEKAARGTDMRSFPWGNQQPNCCLIAAGLHGYTCHGCLPWEAEESYPLAVGTRPAGASPYGVLDMAGNVSEWVADVHSAYYYDESPYYNPVNTQPSAWADDVYHVYRDTRAWLYLGDDTIWGLPWVTRRGAESDGEWTCLSRWCLMGFRCAM